MGKFDHLIQAIDSDIKGLSALEEQFRKHTITRALSVGKAKATALNIINLFKKWSEWQEERQEEAANLNGIDTSKDNWKEQLTKIRDRIIETQRKINAGVATNAEIANMPTLKNASTLDTMESVWHFIFEKEWEGILAIIAGILGVDASHVEDVPASCVFDFIVNDKVVYAFLPVSAKRALNEHFFMLQNQAESHGAHTQHTLNRAQRRNMTGKKK